MQVMKIGRFLIAVAFLGNAYADTTPVMLEKMYRIYDFDSIIADGYFTLDIVTKPAESAYLTTSTYADNPIQVSVHNHTLYLVAKYNFQPNLPRPTAHIRLAILKNLAVYGPTIVHSQSPMTKDFSLKTEGSGNVELSNVGAIRSIIQKGNNTIRVSGIATEKLEINNTGFGKTILAGQVNNLYAAIDKTAILRARDLAANFISIQAKHNAQAYIHATQSLNAFADQSSVIYYYKQPQDLGNYTTASGNVLPITDQ